MTNFDRPGLYLIAVTCFALVLARCWWLVRAEVRPRRRSAEAARIAALLRRSAAPPRQLTPTDPD